MEFPPYSFLGSPVFEFHPTTRCIIRPASSAENELDVDILRSVFNSISKFGYKSVNTQCLKKMPGYMETDGIDDEKCLAENIDWLNGLDANCIEKIQEIVAKLIDKTDDVLAALKGYRDGYSDVEIMTLDKTARTYPYRLVGRGGYIYLKVSKHTFDDVKMMSAAEFLSLCKDKLEGLNLSGLPLADAKLREAKLNNRNLSHIDFKNADLSDADLSDAVLRWTILREANLSGADLSRVDLLHASLCMADLRKAKLPGAKLLFVNLLGALFDDDTNLCDTEIVLSLPTWTQQTLNDYLNHLKNTENDSLLTTIGRMNNNKYQKLKLSLVHQIIDSLGKVSDAEISGISESLMAIFMSNPIYVNDGQISAFIVKRLLPPPNYWQQILLTL